MTAMSHWTGKLSSSGLEQCRFVQHLPGPARNELVTQMGMIVESQSAPPVRAIERVQGRIESIPSTDTEARRARHNVRRRHL